ncbi:uncharacterized protein B0T15DRAFT_42963 [Chaetomium strumarium]|uniref:Uncharacterized protein n=1 Tax=Chaetomium strumarium TaxID=1170767 RepID=A0AAJ0H313_9PEZI|nr:hypothetical protein B0T15DRAFT_42963 [Chaetomium strumarium]
MTRHDSDSFPSADSTAAGIDALPFLQFYARLPCASVPHHPINSNWMPSLASVLAIGTRAVTAGQRYLAQPVTFCSTTSYAVVLLPLLSSDCIPCLLIFSATLIYVSLPFLHHISTLYGAAMLCWLG